MASKGWVKLHRSITEHWVWDCEFSYAQAWVDLLINANHSERKITIKGQLITIERGQQARSEVTLSKLWKWSRNKVRRFLKNLESDGMITQKTTHLTSIITICNYNDFQGDDTAGGTGKGQQAKQVKDSRRNTNKNVKNEDNEEIVPLSKMKEIPEGLNHEAWGEWLSYKKETKSPYKTERGEKAKVNELIKLSSGNLLNQSLIIRQSIDNEWKGLFELKGEFKSQQQVQQQTYDHEAARQREIEEIRKGLI